MKKSMLLSLMFVATLSAKQIQEKPDFIIYTEANDRQNHFIPSGWMGDYGDLKMDQRCNVNPATGSTCIKVIYSALRKQGAGWSGIYWQHPANNWGDKRGGYDLSGYKYLTFMIKGDKGGELIDKFMIGGITGNTEEGDSDEASSDMIELTKEWKTVSIPISLLDFSHIIGGFGFAINADNNPVGATFYIDDVKLTNKKS